MDKIISQQALHLTIGATDWTTVRSIRRVVECSTISIRAVPGISGLCVVDNWSQTSWVVLSWGVTGPQAPAARWAHVDVVHVQSSTLGAIPSIIRVHVACVRGRVVVVLWLRWTHFLALISARRLKDSRVNCVLLDLIDELIVMIPIDDCVKVLKTAENEDWRWNVRWCVVIW